MAAPALLYWYGQVDVARGVLFYQHRRASQRSVKVHPRCGSKKDLVTPFLPGFLNKIPLLVCESNVLSGKADECGMMVTPFKIGPLMKLKVQSVYSSGLFSNATTQPLNY